MAGKPGKAKGTGGRPTPRALALTPADLRARLGAMASRQDANDFLTADRITREQLRGIASAFNIETLSRATRQDIADRIVEDTLGFRLSHDAIGRARG